jgi:hypothetical protein
VQLHLRGTRGDVTKLLHLCHKRATASAGTLGQ